MTEYKLKAQKRTKEFKRSNSSIPAVVYGKGFDSINLELDSLIFNRLFKEAGTSNLIELDIDSMSPFKTLVHDIQRDPVTGQFIHIDFFKVNMKEKIHAEVPLSFVGDSDAVINLEGSLITPIDSIEVECLPANLPSEIEVNISVLDDFEKNIKISDLSIPAGVEVMSEPEEIVAFVQEPRSEEELAELEEEVVENVEGVEVENKGEEAAESEDAEATEEKKEE